MECIRPFDLVPVSGWGRQVVDYVYPLDDKNTPLQLDFSPRLRHQVFWAKFYLTCIQRTAEGSGQSAGSGGDDVIEGGGMRFGDVWGNPVMSGDCAMDTEQDRLRFGR